MNETRRLFNEIAKQPTYVQELTDYERAKVSELIANIIDNCTQRAILLLEGNQNYNYPDDIKDDQKIEYWLKKSSQYTTAVKVKNIIKQFSEKAKERKESNTPNEEETETSNADKLSVAADWMDEFMRKITKPELPTDDEIKQLFNEVYPGFKLEFDMSSLKTPKFAKGGNLQKTSISEALKFIVLAKHPGINDITGDAIYRRYKKMGYW